MILSSNYHSCLILANEYITQRYHSNTKVFAVKRNSRLFLALHSLAHMAEEPGRTYTSDELAKHICTNPVVVRRVLGNLRKAGILAAKKGHAGGWRLAHAPETITLADVYLALDESLAVYDEGENTPACSTERALQKKISGVLREIEQGLIQKLADIPISKVRGS